MKIDQEQGNGDENFWLFYEKWLTTNTISENSLSLSEQIAPRMAMDISLCEDVKNLCGIIINNNHHKLI